ncbi:MAG: hypothetical protein NC489_07980 [Ruminococcus flavefaciens]|nr:hypothetical protein [Ruminococcus flavefaciens]
MYTLVPGGGFIICESIGDIDPNVPMPPMTEKRQDMLLKDTCDRDPVQRALVKLGELYREDIKPLMNLDYQPDDVQSIFATTDRVLNVVIRITDKLTDQISKICAATMIKERVYGTRYCGDKFYANVGNFMRNKKKIFQRGLAEYHYSVDSLPFFRGDWQICRVAEIIAGKPELLDEFIDQNMLIAICGADRDFGDMFNGFVDILSAFFEDTERLARMERTLDKSIYLERLMEMLGDHNICDTVRSEYILDGPQFIRLISTVNRKTMQDLYTIQCNIVDGVARTSEVNLSKILTRTVNMFTVATLYIMYQAYQLRDIYCWAQAVNRYTDTLLAELKAD